MAAGPSAVRGRGHTGVSRAARSHLRSVELSRFGTADEDAFRAVLEAETERLRSALPQGTQAWGLARKLLNIFLRDCAYTGHLSEAHGLLRAEEFYEVPLDSIVARALKRAGDRGRLPRWRGVRNLSPESSRVFQAAARAEARKEGIARLHLDALWWAFLREDEDS